MFDGHPKTGMVVSALLIAGVSALLSSYATLQVVDAQASANAERMDRMEAQWRHRIDRMESRLTSRIEAVESLLIEMRRNRIGQGLEVPDTIHPYRAATTDDS